MLKMQEHGLAPFGPGSNMTKSQYALHVAELEEQEKKAQNEAEPSPSRTPGAQGKYGSPRKYIFHDFDYINPKTKIPQGETETSKKMRNQALMNTARSLTKISNKFGTSRNSVTKMGGSIYHAREDGSVDQRNKASRLGGHKSPLRALHFVEPYK